MLLEPLRNDLRYLGARKTLVRIAVRVADRAGTMGVYSVIQATPDDVTPAFRDLKSPYECRLATHDEMLQLSRSSRKAVSANFVRRSVARNDECMAVFDRGRVVSFGWYSPPPARLPGPLLMHFDPGYLYMHSGHTIPEYRGQRLHALALCHALRNYADRGYKGIVSVAETINFRSRQSVARMGFKDVATIWRFGLKHCWSAVVQTRGAGTHIRLEREPLPSQPEACEATRGIHSKATASLAR